MSTSYVISMCFVTLVSSERTSVTTDLGTIIGETALVSVQDANYTIKTFLGIPYAEPPIGERRFKKTEVLTTNHGSIDARSFGPVCPQLPSLLKPDEFKSQSEDCLFLNIYVPERPLTDAQCLMAVMVYIHGGGFMYESAQQYSGDVISALHDVIVVTINYRIGIFGFLTLGVPEGRGNLGFWDQHVALQWVNKHIGAFGGDNNKVTLFGQSAGGQSTTFQALFSQNAGLFQRFISESGNPSMIPNSRLAMNFNPRAQLTYVTEIMGCNHTSIKDTVSCLQSDSLTTATIMDKLRAVSSDVLNQPLLMFIPTIDGDIIKTDPANLRAMSNYHLDDLTFYRSLDMLTGFNNLEGALFADLFLPDVEQFRPTLEEFYQIYLPTSLQVASLNPSAVLTDMIRSEYTNWGNSGHTVDAVRDQYLKLWLDLMYSTGTLSFAQLHDAGSASGSTFVYIFSASPSNHLVPVPSWAKGANHGDELPFVFGFSKAMEATLFGSRYQPPADWERHLSDRMMTHWTNFAKSGDPNTPSSVSPTWPQYDTRHQRYIDLERYMSNNSTKQFLLSDQLDFWLNVVPAVNKRGQNPNGNFGL